MRALVSVSDRTGLVELARGLVRRGVEIVATSGTGRALAQAGVTARLVEEFTGAPEMLGGRVKTLHPKVHGALLARPERDDDQADIARAGLELIDIAVVNLYPFRQTVARPHTFEEAIEQIDIGGPSMLRSAAKNAARVLPVCRPEDYPAVLRALDEGVTPEFRRALQARAFAHTAAYDSAIAEYLGQRGAEALPETLSLTVERQQTLRYGENPHQSAALYRFPGVAEPSVASAKVLQGKELSYNNLLDAAAAVGCLVDVPRSNEPACVVVKHLIPCGVARAASVLEAYQHARDGDPVSAFGGIVAHSHEVDRATAEEMAKLFLEVVVAPSYSADAREVLAKKKNLRLLDLPAVALPECSSGLGKLELRSIPGGLLVQSRDLALTDVRQAKVVSRRAPTEAELSDLALAWAVCKHVRSNAIVLAKDGVVMGVGPGQPNRVDSVRIAAQRAGARARGSMLASDAFFPFPDALLAGVEVGITAAVEPGGSVRDEEVIRAANESGIALLFTGERHFRH